MSKRLQVVMDEAEYRALQKLARRHRMTVSQWVRRALDAARQGEPVADAGSKLAVVREALKHSYPTGDIEQILEETERGYRGEGDA